MTGLDELSTRMCAAIFGPLPRSDQQKWAQLYLRGLLAVEGRKTMSGIAALVGKKTVEQNLHHFISKSSWDCQPVRRLLAQHVDALIRPEAWVVSDMVIPKKGAHTVGVERTFVPRLGRVVNSQRAFGVWLAAEQASCPVNWRLMLPSEWATCPVKRDRADIPECAQAESATVCALNAALEMTGHWGIEPVPLIMNARDGDVPRLVAELTRRGLPFLIGIDDSVEVVAAQAASPRPADRIGDHLIKLRQPVEWWDVRACVRRLSLAATMPVSLVAGSRRQLTLVAEWSGRGPAPAALWLTNLTDPASSLVRLSKLIRRVDKDFAEVSAKVGIQDFEGRSFPGWHRHATLASAAHAVLMTAAAGHELADETMLASSGTRSRP